MCMYVASPPQRTHSFGDNEDRVWLLTECRRSSSLATADRSRHQQAFLHLPVELADVTGNLNMAFCQAQDGCLRGCEKSQTWGMELLKAVSDESAWERLQDWRYERFENKFTAFLIPCCTTHVCSWDPALHLVLSGIFLLPLLAPFNHSCLQQ